MADHQRESRNELSELSAKATPGPWKADPKRLIIGNQMGPIMCYLAGHADAEEGMKVSLGSERIADHHFVAALVNAYRAGELVHRALVSETACMEGYPGIAHDFETMRSVLEQVSTYRMDCRCSMRERDSGHHVDCHAPEFQALQDMARNAIKNAAPQELPAVTSARPAKREQDAASAETLTGRPGRATERAPDTQSGDSAQQPAAAAPATRTERG